MFVRKYEKLRSDFLSAGFQTFTQNCLIQRQKNKKLSEQSICESAALTRDKGKHSFYPEKIIILNLLVFTTSIMFALSLESK